MPSHPDRVRRNYPEGVPAFGSARRLAFHPEAFSALFPPDDSVVMLSGIGRWIGLPETVAIVQPEAHRLAPESHVPYEDNFTIRPDATLLGGYPLPLLPRCGDHACVMCYPNG